MTYYDVKERINDWFFNMNVEEQRNELINMITGCKVFGHFIIIGMRTIIFLYDINKREIFDMKLLKNLNKDEVYKKYFTKMKGARDAKMYNERRILDINLRKNKIIKVKILEYLIQKYNISYNLVGITKLVSFVPFTGLMSIELEGIEDIN